MQSTDGSHSVFTMMMIENTMMLIRGNNRTIQSITQEPHSDESPILPRLFVEHSGCILLKDCMA